MYPLRPINPVLVMIALLLPSVSWASNSDVSGPGVSPKTTIEARFGIDHQQEGADRYNQRLHLDHGFNDSFSARLVTKQYATRDEGFEYRATDAEVKWQLFDEATAGFDGGFKLVYSMADGDKEPDVAELLWLYEITRNELTYRFNAGAGSELGDEAESGLLMEYSWQVLTPLTPTHKIGLEMFGALGKHNAQNGWDAQEHQLGPVVKGDITDRLSYQTGLLVGVSDSAPDQSFKFFLSYDF